MLRRRGIYGAGRELERLVLGLLLSYRPCFRSFKPALNVFREVAWSCMTSMHVVLNGKAADEVAWEPASTRALMCGETCVIGFAMKAYLLAHALHVKFDGGHKNRVTSQLFANDPCP